ncbi:MAG: ATP-binding protein [Janthinobacterium sp.]
MEAGWIDVIQKMDEVYSQLVQDEIALEEKNQELESSQQFILSVMSSMSDVLVACGRDGAIEESNAALRELAGLSEPQLRGTSVYALLADEDSAERLRAVLGRGEAGSSSSVALELSLQDRRQGQPSRAMPVDVNCTARRDGAGRTVGHVLVGRPMGELKQAYRELSDTHEALKRMQQQLLHAEKLASLGRLVAGVAHELNNPISFVLGNVHALQRYSGRLTQYLDAVHGGADSAQLAQLRRQLRIDPILADLPSLMAGTLEGAQRTTEIVNGLKRFSAVDRDERVAVDLNGVIERAVHWIGKGAAPGFQVHWTPQPITVMGNGGKLLQVFMNLIQNASDAALAGAAAPPQMWISAACDAQEVTLELRDNGSGIAPAQLPHVFDPFFTTKPVGKGTGLGLSISYGIVEQHGGSLTAGNHPDGGACFMLRLPLR